MQITLGNKLSNQETIRISLDTLRRHIGIWGATGTGKTNLLVGVLLQIINQNGGLCFIDPHGDAAMTLADSIPPHRLKDVIYFDPANLDYSIGYNPLANVPYDKRHLVASQIMAVFKQVWELSPDGTPRLIPLLYNSLRLLMDCPDTTLLGIGRLIRDDAYRTMLLGHCKDNAILSFWTETFEGWDKRYRADAVAAVGNRVLPFAADPILRNTLCHGGLELVATMDRKAILICNLSKGRMGDDTSAMIGSFLTIGISQAIQSRADIPEADRPDFTLAVDEFQNFVVRSFATVLAEARKYRLHLVLANQVLAQIPEYIRAVLMGTASTKITFRCGVDDAPVLGKELDWNPQDILDLSDFVMLVKTKEGRVVTNAMKAMTQKAPPQLGTLPPVVQHSQTHHGVRREWVEHAAQAFLS